MIAEIPITRTKIVTPRRRNDLLSRPRLLSALEDILDNKLLIVAAPAGYGKTSLLVDFAAQAQFPICWYSLDPLDEDPLRFIAHLIGSIQVRFPSFGRSSMAALMNTQGQVNIDALVTTIVNDIYEHITEHFAIVLDDYHLIASSKPVDEFINRFIQEVDENCHIVMCSRSLLTLSDLPLLVARSQVIGLSFEELSFRSDEIKQLLEQNYQRSINDFEADELMRQSEGWITGLLLSTQLSMEEADLRLRVARVSGVGLYEYLAQQVHEQQPEHIQEFLLRSSLLEEFDAQLCEEVIGRALGLRDVDWQDYIRHIMRSNLFVLPVGEEHVYLRYHHLFRDFLQKRAQTERPTEVTRILSRLAEFSIERKEWERAYSIYQRLGRERDLIALVEKAGTGLISTGRLNLLSQWLEALPPTMVSARPGLLALQGSVDVVKGKTEHGLSLLNLAIDGLNEDDQRDIRHITLLRRSTTHRLLGRYQAALKDAESVLESLNHRGGDEFVIKAEAYRSRGMAKFYLGKFREALDDLNTALLAYQQINDNESSARVMHEVGMIERNLGNDLSAEETYTRALRHSQHTGNSILQANLYNNLGVLQYYRGEYETAATSLENAIHHARIASYPRVEGYALASIGDLHRDLDAIQSARDAYQLARDIANETKDQFLQFYLDLCEGVLNRLRGKLAPARQGIAIALKKADEVESRIQQNLCRLENGALKIHEKNFDEAQETLQNALEYFSAAGQRVETARCLLYLSILACQTGDSDKVGSHLDQIASLLPSVGQRHPLVTAAREFRSMIDSLEEKSDHHPVVTDLIIQMDAFEKRLPKLRKLLRRRAVTVPFAPPRLVIHSLGKMEVKVNGRTVTTSDWMTQTARDLFFLFLNHPEGLTKEQVGEIFWPDSSPAELKLRFKNTVYRLRHAIGRDTISFFDDVYSFNPDLDYEYDLETFQRELTLAQSSRDTNEKINHLRNAVRIYRGDFLPDVDETWVIHERERLRQAYQDAVLSLSDLYFQAGQLEAALDVCQRAIAADSCLEEAYRLAMQVYAKNGNRAGIVRTYEQCKKALYEEVGAEPSPQTRRLFEELMR